MESAKKALAALGLTPVDDMSYSELLKYTKDMDEIDVERSGMGDLLRKAKAREQKAEKPVKKSKGGMTTKKPQMMYGGMANGKKHNYACGGSVHSKI